MTTLREAVALPAIFLTVVLLGGMRLAERADLVAPTPYMLVLGVLLIRVVVQSGALAPEALMSSSRTALANLNGIVVLLTLWVAAAQTLALLTPDSGVPRLAFSVFFLVLLLNTSAASPGRQQLLKSLAVTFGAAFVLKFVVLLGLTSPGDGAIKRALTALFDSVTIGALLQKPLSPATAYIALAAVGFFLAGLTLLPHRSGPPAGEALVPRATWPVP